MPRIFTGASITFRGGGEVSEKARSFWNTIADLPTQQMSPLALGRA